MRASYKKGIEWIALNDGAGDDEALDVQFISEMVSVALLADLFGKEYLDVAKDIVRFRAKATCKICGGELGTADKSGAHYLCAARKNLGHPTPKLTPAHTQDDAFKQQQARDIALFTYEGARMGRVK